MNYVQMTIVFMFDVFLGTTLVVLICKQMLKTYLGIGISKLGILGEKGLKPIIFFLHNYDCSLKQTRKRTFTEGSVTGSLKRTRSKQQANFCCSYWNLFA